MDIKEKGDLIKDILECMGHATDLDSDDSDKDDILIGLTDLCNKATLLPIKRVRQLWVKPWRKNKAERGSFTILTKELLLNDEWSYKNYLRMSKVHFKFLLTLIERDITRIDTQMREAIPAAEKLVLTLRFLASGESYQSLDYQTRVSKSAISGIVPEVCEILFKKLKGSYLKFPSNSLEWEAIAKEFAIKWQYPNCIGALDGKHINFRPLRKDGAFYHNYKGTNSIILMALVDANCKFVFVDIGCNGRTNDAGVFLQSKLRTVLQEEKEIPKNSVVGNGRCLPYVVVGDDAFPMQTHLMKPYPYHTKSTEKQVFNARLSRARHVVEHAFGILANRFRVFLAPINEGVEKVEIITFACCDLHNFLMERDDTYTNSCQYSSSESNGTSLDSVYNPRKGEAELIRQNFMAYFTNEGKLDWLQPN